MIPIYVIDHNNGMIEVTKDFDSAIERMEWSIDSGPLSAFSKEQPQLFFDAGIEIPKLHRLVYLASKTRREAMDVVIHDAATKPSTITETARYHMIENQDPDCLVSCAILELAESEDHEFEEDRDDLLTHLDNDIRNALKREITTNGLNEAFASFKAFQQPQSIIPDIDDVEMMDLNQIIDSIVERARERFDNAARCLAPKALTP